MMLRVGVSILLSMALGGLFIISGVILPSQWNGGPVLVGFGIVLVGGSVVWWLLFLLKVIFSGCVGWFVRLVDKERF